MSRFASFAAIAACAVLPAARLLGRTLLFDFETEAQVRLWHDEHAKTIGGGKRLARAPKFATAGRYALHVTIPAWRPKEHGGRFSWPAFECKPPIPNWSQFDRLVFDVTNAGAETQRLMMFISDAKHATRSGILNRWTLPPYSHTRATVRLRPALQAKHLDPGNIRVIHIFTENPPAPMTLYLDAFQLLAPGEPPLPLPAAYLRDFAEMQQKTFAGLRKSLLDGFRDLERQAAAVPAEAAWVHAQRRTAEQRLAQLAAALDSASGPDLLRAPLELDRIAQNLPVLRKTLNLALAFDAVRPAVQDNGNPRSDVIAGFASSMVKIRPRRPGPAIAISDHAELSLARNEYESLQLVVLPRIRPLRHVAVQITPLRGPQGAIFPKKAIQTVLMGYVRTRRAPPYDSKAWVGWWPDPILDFLHAADIAPGVAQSFWIRLHAPANQPAGLYRGTLAVTTGTPPKPLFHFKFRVRVYNFTLARTSPLPLAITFHPEDSIRPETREQQMAWRKSPRYPINAWKKHRSEWADFLADYYITIDSLYAYHGEGAPRFDLLEKLNKEGRLGRFNLGYYGMAPLQPAAARRWKNEQAAWLKPRYDRAKALGILSHAYIYGCDEANPNLFPRLQRAAQIIKQIAPGVPVMTTARDRSYGLKSGVTAVDWWCPLTPAFRPKRAAAARAAGKQVWWYICCGPGHPYANMFIEFPAIEGRLLMGAMTAKYRPDGFLYYQISIWNSEHPIEKGPFTDWNPRSWTTYHGDGSWTCAGPDGTPLPTIRLENFRDGLEDFAYCRILEKRLHAVEAESKQPAAKTRAWIDRARKLLAVPETVVRSMRRYTHSPAVLYRWRNALAETIETAPTP